MLFLLKFQAITVIIFLPIAVNGNLYRYLCSEKEAIRCYEELTNRFGHILKLNLNSSPISAIFEMLEIVSTNQMNDAFEASSLGLFIFNGTTSPYVKY